LPLQRQAMKPEGHALGMSTAARFDAIRTRAEVVAWFRGIPLPPGDWNRPLDTIERNDQRGLLRLADEAGAIFKGRAWGGLWIYVVGLPLCRNILRLHEDDLRPVTIDVSTLFEKGLLRQMEGSDHRIYRSALVQALKVTRPDQQAVEASASIGSAFDALALSDDVAALPARTFRALLSQVVFDELARVVFGIGAHCPAYARLAAAYAELGGNGLVWNVGLRQQRACTEIAAILREHIATSEGTGGAKGSLLGQLADQGAVSAVMLGNLIYMVEMGRYDMAAFFRWLTWFAARHPEWMDRVAGDADTQQGVTAAFVMEALRLEQSERLVRQVKRDFVADGFLFPKGARVRLCIWESHKCGEAHADPFAFDPGRFLGKRPGPDHYSPFGIDRHQCPFGTYSIHLGSIFLTEMARRYHVEAVGIGSPVRGLYHWEPAEEFSPVLRRRAPKSADGVDSIC
jgi:cytochrome P450